MAKKEERFEVVFQDGSQLKDAGTRQILVDKETGVHYLVWRSGYAGASPRCWIRRGMWSSRSNGQKASVCVERNRKAMKTGLVLEGGAMRGLFSAGVMDVMMENGIRFDGIIGVSAGWRSASITNRDNGTCVPL